MGSNINQEANIQAAKALICKLFDNIEFGKSVWTEPVGLVSGKFLNLLVTAHTGIPKQPGYRKAQADRANAGRRQRPSQEWNRQYRLGPYRI